MMEKMFSYGESIIRKKKTDKWAREERKYEKELVELLKVYNNVQLFIRQPIYTNGFTR